MNGLIIDCFAGGGGASTGIEMALGRPVDIAINHDPQAILMHKTNHPNTLHLTEDIFKVDLKKYVGDKHVFLMWASPDCSSYSKAKGGQPRKKGLRILPWAVYKHAREILPDVIIMENVEEIQQWGPLDDTGHPIPERKGEDYQRFISAMQSLGYIFDSRELIAADYGAPTTRRRWYAIFRRYGLVTAFITKFYKTGTGQGCNEPLHTITTSPGHFGLVTAFLIKYYGSGCGQNLDRPLGTITTKDRFGLVTVPIRIKGDIYIISDIFLRMLKPEELKLMQGFPQDYIIDRDYRWRRYSVKDQVARIGNSVSPVMAQRLVEANCGYLKVGERIPNLYTEQEDTGQMRFA